MISLFKRNFFNDRPFVLHPIFFSIYPFLFIFSFNFALGENVTFSEFLPYILITLSVTAFLMLVLFLVLRSVRKAGALVSLILFLFFFYGHFEMFLEWFLTKKGIILEQNISTLLYTCWAGIFLVGAYLIIKTRSDLKILTSFLNVTVGILLLFSLYNITAYVLKNRGGSEGTLEETYKYEIESTGNHFVVDTPDIYYIILDGYGGQAVLKNLYNFDNQPFIDSLEERGFFVASNSQANYPPSTNPSIHSTMSMGYLHGRDISEDSLMRNIEGVIAEDLLQSVPDGTSHIGRIVESYGYDFISNHHVFGLNTLHSKLKFRMRGKLKYAIFGLSVDELFNVVVQTTMLRHSATSTLLSEVYRTKQLSIFSQIVNTKRFNGKPKFVFGHIRLPHPPFVFGANGEKPSDVSWDRWGAMAWADRSAYINQLIYLNKLTIKKIDEIMLNSKNPPIIVIQGDHGPASLLSNKSSWASPNDNMIMERSSILNAYHLPGGGNDLVYDSITPVNTFRIISDHYFGTKYGLLKDRVFWRDYYYDKTNTEWKEITESAYKDFPEIDIRNMFIVNQDFENDITHWETDVAGGGLISWSDGAMQFRQETKTNWIHAYQSVGYLTAGTTYQISIMTTDSSHNLKLGLGTVEPKEGIEYLGSAKVEGGYNASIDNGKEYVISVVPSTDGPHYIVISDGGPPGQISKVNNVSMLKATP